MALTKTGETREAEEGDVAERGAAGEPGMPPPKKLAPDEESEFVHSVPLGALRSSRGLQLLLAYALYFALVILIVLATGSAATLVGIFMAGPIVAFYMSRFLYVRTFKPFTIDDVPEGEKRSKAWTRRDVVASVAFWVILSVAFLPAAVADFFSSEEPLFIVVFLYNLLGSLSILFCTLVVVDGVDMCYNLVTKGRDPKTWFSLEVRAQRIKVGVAFIIYLSITTVSLVNSYGAPLVIEKDVFLDGFPTCLNGYRMVMVSDVHSGALVGRAENTRLVEQVNALAGDTVMFVGDFADGTPEDVGVAVEPFKEVSAPDGTYYVTGNHEYIYEGGGDAWEDFWTSLNVTVLSNERTALPVLTNTSLCGTDQFYLAGVQDYGDGNPDLNGALLGRNPSIATTVLLAHEPAHSAEAATLDVQLQLSGHNHGGQLYPLHGLTYLSQPQFAGLEMAEDTLVYTSQGAFGWGPRTRFGSRNNIDVLTLYSADEGENDLSLHYSIIWAWMSFPFIIVPTIIAVWYGLANGGCGGVGAKIGAKCGGAHSKPRKSRSDSITY